MKTKKLTNGMIATRCLNATTRQLAPGLKVRRRFVEIEPLPLPQAFANADHPAKLSRTDAGKLLGSALPPES